MAVNKNVPAIRFKDFDEEWEDTNLGELSAVKTGFPFDSKTFEADGEYLVITNGNIQHESFSVNSTLGNRINLYNSNLKEYVLNIDDILVTMDGTVGRTAKVTEQKQILAQRVGRLVPKTNADFLYQYLNTGDFFGEMTIVSHGGTIKHISLSEIASYKSSAPKNILEQTQIGDYFKELDRLILLQEQKLKKVSNLKKAMLEKMFPKEGADVPEIRFREFTKKWEWKKFKDNILSIQTGTNLLGNTTNTGAPLIKMGNIQRGFFSFDKIDALPTSVEVEKENLAYYGDFLFNTRNTLDLVGKGATWMGVNGKFAFNNNIARFKFKNIDTMFFNYLYNTQQLITQVKARAMGTTSVAAIYPQNLNSIAYALPHLDEQQKIGRYFQSLDQLINQSQQQIEQLKHLKQALLQKMFI